MTEAEQARAEAERVCAELRSRGDELSRHAAALIEGTLDCFADVVETIDTLRDERDKLESNLRGYQDLWCRVPAAARHAVVDRPGQVYRRPDGMPDPCDARVHVEAGRVRVTFHGTPVHDVVAASERQGWIEHIVSDDRGKLQLTRYGVPITARVYGKVRLSWRT